MSNFKTLYGPWALIVGGSEGLGQAFAEELAASGLNLILVARKAQPLEEVAAQMRARCVGIQVRTVAADMSGDMGVRAVIDAAKDATIGLLVHNAGAGSELRPFIGGDLDYDRRLVGLNVLTKMALVHHFGAGVQARGRGGIVLIESVSGLAGNPGLASYSGAKAFGRVFAEALWHELKTHGVHVLSFPIGLTSTPANARNFPLSAQLGMDPAVVAKEALANISNGPVRYPSDYETKARTIRSMDHAAAVQAAFDRSTVFRTT